MVRLWTIEALAHGAEVVSYFRWRQAPFAQEQMHAGLNLPRSHELSPGGREAAAAAGDLMRLGDLPRARLRKSRSSTITKRIGSRRSSRKAQIFAIRNWFSAGTRPSEVSASTSISCRRARASTSIVSCWRPPCRSFRRAPKRPSPPRGDWWSSARAPDRRRATFPFPKSCRPARCNAFFVHA